jgi:tRNA (cmo5U34)-methyltransferase
MARVSFMVDQRPDRIYATPLQKISDFTFDESVARVFPDMIQRSVPGYTTIIPMIELMTERYVQPNTFCYDLGCSLGASTLAMRHGMKKTNARLIAIDNSEAMLDRCSHYIELDNSPTPVELVCQDMLVTDFHPCSVVTMNFTLQFLPPNARFQILKQISDALTPKGVMILSEKICFDPSEQTHLEQLHLDFKKANGYSEMEISQKRSSLEKVLIPETIEKHKQRIIDAGFSEVFLWYQCFNFVSFLAIK